MIVCSVVDLSDPANPTLEVPFDALLGRSEKGDDGDTSAAGMLELRSSFAAAALQSFNAAAKMHSAISYFFVGVSAPLDSSEEPSLLGVCIY